MRVAVIGVSDKPDRYSNMCVRQLLHHGHEVFPFGFKDFDIDGLRIITDKMPVDDIDTITLYLSPARQPEWYDLILNSHPRRIIFNPGTYNPELEKLAADHHIQTVESCTLFMLSSGTFED